MKKTLIQIWTFLREPKNQRLLMIIATAILAFFIIKSCNHNEALQLKNKRLNYNLTAAQDTVKVVKNKNGELQTEISSYVTTTEELKIINQYLNQEVTAQKGHVIYISSLNIKLQNKIVKLKDSLSQEEPIAENDSTFKIPWNFNQIYDSLNYRLLAGQTRFIATSDGKILNLGTKLMEDEWSFNLTTGLREEKGKLRIFAKSDYPGLTIPQMRGSLIDPNESKVIKSLMQKKHWFPNTFSVGPQLGLGYGFPGRWGIYVGVGIQYNIYQW